MKLQIVSSKGKLIKEYFFDFDGLMSRAQSSSLHDPLRSVAQLINEDIKKGGINLNDNSLIALEKQLADFSLSEDSSKVLCLKVNDMYADKPITPGDITMEQSELFEKIIVYPNSLSMKVYNLLVGLDEMKERLIKEVIFMISPESILKWSKEKHKGKDIAALKVLEQRSPFLIFGGDVGTGKTALAESFGNAIAEFIDKPVKLFKFSILTRGSGIVGDMTRLITAAFKTAETEVSQINGPVILLLDEADTLAQSREAIQMHHEDKAGVNALIQGIDRMRFQRRPILIIFCTNRLSAIDPAIRRRAVDIFEFTRPNEEQRKVIFKMYTADIGLSGENIEKLANITGPSTKYPYGFTYSDLINKVIPSALFICYPDAPLSFHALEKAVVSTRPTRPFEEVEDEKKKQKVFK